VFALSTTLFVAAYSVARIFTSVSEELGIAMCTDHYKTFSSNERSKYKNIIFHHVQYMSAVKCIFPLCSRNLFLRLHFVYYTHGTRACKAYRQCSHLVCLTHSIDRVPNIILMYIVMGGKKVRKIKMWRRYNIVSSRLACTRYIIISIWWYVDQRPKRNRTSVK